MPRIRACKGISLYGQEYLLVLPERYLPSIDQGQTGGEFGHEIKATERVMLRCGANWRPTTVKRVIDTYPTSTRVAKVATDEGTAFLKGMGNPAGNESLATELVCGELAAWFGLRTPDFAILGVADIEIPLDGRGFVEFGPAFVSRELPGATGDGGNVFLSKISRPRDVAKLVVFDTWIRNRDRYPPPDDLEEPPENRDNLFFTPNGRKFDLVALDHSHCFVETTLEDELGGSHLLEDDRIYGAFPEFVPYLSHEAVALAARRLAEIDLGMVTEVVGSVPREWGVSAGLRDTWARLIFERAKRVSSYVLPRLTRQLNMEF